MTTLTTNEPNTTGNTEALEMPVLQAVEPSHIHIPRPSRVLRLAISAAPFERSAPAAMGAAD